jgi:hypothetical protein
MIPSSQSLWCSEDKEMQNTSRIGQIDISDWDFYSKASAHTLVSTVPMVTLMVDSVDFVGSRAFQLGKSPTRHIHQTMTRFGLKSYVLYKSIHQLESLCAWLRRASADCPPPSACVSISVANL